MALGIRSAACTKKYLGDITGNTTILLQSILAPTSLLLESRERFPKKL